MIKDLNKIGKSGSRPEFQMKILPKPQLTGFSFQKGNILLQLELFTGIDKLNVLMNNGEETGHLRLFLKRFIV